MGEDNTDTLEIVAEVTGVHEPLLPNTDTVNTPCKDSLTSDFTACKSEQRGITFGCGSNDLSDCPAANLVTVKEEIEEVFIGELEGYSEDSSDAPVALDEINTEDEEAAGDDPILTGLLLIDDQGIPYTLTPDEPSDLPRLLTTSTSTESSAVSKTDLPSGTNSSTAAGPRSQPSPSTTAQPVRILANSSTNAPILLLPSAHPSISTSKTISNSGLLALSLPLSIAQKSPSTPVLIVLSPLTTASVPSSSSASASPLAVNDPVTSSLPISQTPSPSSVSLPLSSVQTNPNSLPSTPSLPVLNLDSNTLSTSFGNSNCSAHTSPAVSCATSSNQPNPDHSSEIIFPKCSPRQRLPQPEIPSDTKSSSVADTKIKPSNSPLPSSLSPDETPQQPSPPTTPNPPVHPGLKVAPSEVSQPVSTSDTSKGQFSTHDPCYTSSGTPPPTVIFPTNHPKNLSLSPTCPRRILYCQFCPRAFYYLSDLERHSITHSQSKPHVCPLCSKAFKRSSHLERHKHIHTGQRNFVCPICSKRFREAGELLRHQRVHTGEKPFQCPQCHMRFAERNTLRRHAKRKHQDQHGLDGQGDGRHVPGGIQGEQEDSAEWYSSTVPELDSENEMDKD
ncbi:leucine-rich repeat extensin-like protein 5 [Megalops cyprinoides]|uniref:leucine-rich repeat extensin-like protein 5 n=1 Tax=Megalops cyprinoides TaxID=118141 RepID=UPI0018644465|nr:leucine-rich repeat extensin-like protein 5 [Megalops cyprinoides]